MYVPVMRCVPMVLLGLLGCICAPLERGVSTSHSRPGPQVLLHLTVTAKHLLWARFCAKCFIYISSFNLNSNLNMEVISVLDRWGN